MADDSCDYLFGPLVGSQVFAHGDQAAETTFVHHGYEAVPSGPVMLDVEWPLYAASTDGKSPGPLIASLHACLKLDIPAATPERLAALRKRLQSQLRQPGLSDKDHLALTKEVVYTRHEACTPVAWQMIEAPRPLDWTTDLIHFLSQFPEERHDLDARLAKLGTDPDGPGPMDAFNYWKKCKTGVPPKAWPTLEKAENVWTRALLYVNFPKQCGKQWKDALLEDLGGLSKAVPSTQFDRLLADLDSDDFDVREKASAQLIRLGERVEVQLRHRKTAISRRKPVGELARSSPSCGT